MAEQPPGGASRPCSRCNISFECGIAAETCWCNQLPPLEINRIDAAAECLCPACLRTAIELQARTKRAISKDK